MRFLFFIISILLFGLSSCKKDKVPTIEIDPNCIDTVSFQSSILPMIENNCLSCHFSGNSTGYTFTNHTNISTNANAMLNSMRGEAGYAQMPDGLPPLSDSLVQLFKCWVNQGKLNN